MKTFYTYLSILIFLIFSTGALSQDKTNETDKSIESAIDSISGKTPGEIPSSGNPDTAISKSFEVPCEKISDADTEKICWETFRKYLIYFQNGYSQRESVLKFQNDSTKIILAIVISLVLLGMFFAWYQFSIAMKAMQQRLDSGESISETVIEQQEIKISGSEIVARSSYLGVIILIVSLAFFYLYLVFVYPIKEVF